MSQARRTGLRVVVEADGGSRGNPGPAGYGSVVLDADTGTVLAERKESIGQATNNVAEYRGLIAGLAAAAELGAVEVEVRMDSKLVIEQMSGRWQVKHPAMKPLVRQAGDLAGQFDRISYRWIPRAQNSHADRLANEAMDAAAVLDKTVLDRVTTGGSADPVSAWAPSAAAPTTLILVRHGVTELSLSRRFAGRSDLALTTLGVEQARRTAERVERLGGGQAVISSPLLRTRQTAQQIADQLGLPVSVEDGLIETDYGDWDGRSFDEVQQRWPAELQRWLVDPAARPTSGESFETVGRRVEQARDRILGRYRGDTVVLVSHVSPIKLLVRSALGAPVSAVHRMFLDAASITVIDYLDGDPAGASLRCYNDTGHLSEG